MPDERLKLRERETDGECAPAMMKRREWVTQTVAASLRRKGWGEKAGGGQNKQNLF